MFLGRFERERKNELGLVGNENLERNSEWNGNAEEREMSNGVGCQV